MRVFALLFLLTTAVSAQSAMQFVTVGPNATITPNGIGHEMSTVSACSAASGAAPVAPRPIVMEVVISKGSIARVSPMFSSGNTSFDEKAVRCLQNLPAEFTTKTGDIAMFVAVYSKDGNIAPVLDPSTVTIPVQRPLANAITVPHNQ